MTVVRPDLVLLRPRQDFYASRHAGPADILLIVEIAASSIEYDKTVKARVYAQHGIPEYWLADLSGNRLLRFSEPRDGVYQQIAEHHRGEWLAPALLPSCAVTSDAFLVE